MNNFWSKKFLLLDSALSLGHIIICASISHQSGSSWYIFVCIYTIPAHKDDIGKHGRSFFSGWWQWIKGRKMLTMESQSKAQCNSTTFWERKTLGHDFAVKAQFAHTKCVYEIYRAVLLRFAFARRSNCAVFIFQYTWLLASTSEEVVSVHARVFYFCGNFNEQLAVLEYAECVVRDYWFSHSMGNCIWGGKFFACCDFIKQQNWLLK